LKRPYILINAREAPDPLVAAELLGEFIEGNNIQTLNVAGPRARGWKEGYVFALAVIREVLLRSY